MDAIEAALENITYYHGVLSRQETETFLKGRVDGTFLLRKSLRAENTYVISIAYRRECLHYSMSPSSQDGRLMFCINNGTRFPTPWEVCDHYMALKGGLKVRLSYPITKSSIDSSPYVTEIDWYHNDITRVEDSRRLSQGNQIHRSDGIFLVRKKDDSKYVLSLVNAGKVHRYMINRIPQSGRYHVTGKKREFDSLEELVTFHMKNSTEVTGIQCQLTIACPKFFVEKRKVEIPRALESRASACPKHPLSLASELRKILPEGGLDMQWDPDNPQAGVHEDRPSVKSPVLPTSGSRKWLDVFTKTYKKMPRECPGYNSIYQNLPGVGVAPDLFVVEDDISIYEQLGKGHFGAVCLGRCNIAGERRPCAIKFLTGEDVIANKKELLSEAALMQTLDHPNIMRLLAVCETDHHLMLLLELALVGPLKNILKANKATFPVDKIMNIMKQVCDGMAYLAKNNIVHRDLAARNILLVSENFAKVSDFGMSKVLRDSESYYRSAQPKSWPLRWYSPEALTYYKFTTKCDVWSYGVTLWEAFTYGSRPYKGMKGSEILRMLEAGQRLDCPLSCPQEIYDLMLYCWIYEEERRPDFNELFQLVQQICDNLCTLAKR